MRRHTHVQNKETNKQKRTWSQGWKVWYGKAIGERWDYRLCWCVHCHTRGSWWILPPSTMFMCVHLTHWRGTSPMACFDQQNINKHPAKRLEVCPLETCSLGSHSRHIQKTLANRERYSARGWLFQPCQLKHQTGEWRSQPQTPLWAEELPRT